MGLSRATTASEPTRATRIQSRQTYVRPSAFHPGGIKRWTNLTGSLPYFVLMSLFLLIPFSNANSCLLIPWTLRSPGSSADPVSIILRTSFWTSFSPPPLSHVHYISISMGPEWRDEKRTRISHQHPPRQNNPHLAQERNSPSPHLLHPHHPQYPSRPRRLPLKLSLSPFHSTHFPIEEPWH